MTRSRLAVAVLAAAVTVTLTVADDKPKELPQFMLTVYEPADEFAARTGETSRAYWGKYTAYAKALAESGATVGGNAVLPPDTGKAVVGKDGKVTAGSFVSNPAKPGGYFIVRAADLDAAVALAARCPCVAAGGAVEVRPVLVMPAMK